MYDLMWCPTGVFAWSSADDTNLLYTDTNLKSLEKTVNSELLKVSEWLNANKLTLSAKLKLNYVIFRPYQRKLNYLVNI